jgi:hypothetical protein
VPDPGGRFEGYVPARHHDTFAHTEQAAATRRFQYRLHIESAALVGDLHVKPVCINPHAHADSGDTSVARGIGQSLLHDTDAAVSTWDEMRLSTPPC